MNGLEKDIDNLGRVVIPMEFKKKRGLVSNSKVLVSLQNDSILISPTNKHCALCGRKIGNGRQLRLCDACILKIKSEQ